MAREVNRRDYLKQTLDIRNGTPVEPDPERCDGVECNRPTSHPSGKCTECRDE